VSPPAAAGGDTAPVSHTADYWNGMNDPVIARFRANGGVVKGRRWPLILLTTIGVKSGQARLTPLNFSVDGDRLVVIASKGGSATHPSWYLNLVANPLVTIETGRETFRARARAAEEPERTRLFDQQAAQMAFFDSYRRRVTARQIPVVIFERVEATDRINPADSNERTAV
jgi:deazaflavin-dependent oxidoreductase (nitroreductase family)